MNLTDINEIRALLSRHGFRFSKSMGQNFLTADWVPVDIAESALLDENTGVLEVGPGIGCLTEQLSKCAGKVLCVELDKSLKPVLAETLADCDNVELIFGDVLKQNLPELVHEHFGALRPVVCANLPYNVTSPLLTAFIEADCFDSITVMIQREVARRICAPANTADYGAFGIFVQWYMEPEIRLRRREKPPVEVRDEKLMFRVIRAAFNQRRKTLVNALSSQLGVLDKENAARALVNCGFDTKIRGETVDIVGFAKISDEISSIIGADL